MLEAPENGTASKTKTRTHQSMIMCFAGQPANKLYNITECISFQTCCCLRNEIICCSHRKPLCMYGDMSALYIVVNNYELLVNFVTVFYSACLLMPLCAWDTYYLTTLPHMSLHTSCHSLTFPMTGWEIV